MVLLGVLLGIISSAIGQVANWLLLKNITPALSVLGLIIRLFISFAALVGAAFLSIEALLGCAAGQTAVLFTSAIIFYRRGRR